MSSIPTETEAKVTIGGEEYIVHKLKAGKFYEVQKIFAEIISSLSSGTAKTSDSGEGESNEGDQAMSVLSKFPEKISKFVAACMDLEEKELLEKAYPQEITEAFEVCIRLNNVIENLKNSVAPMEKLMGVKETTIKK
jgi:hypothetical protein